MITAAITGYLKINMVFPQLHNCALASRDPSHAATKQLKLTADRQVRRTACNVQIMVIMISKKSLLKLNKKIEPFPCLYLHLACVKINRKVIDTEMKSFRVFIRVRLEQLEPFYYLLASELPNRNSSFRKNGDGDKNLVLNFATNSAALFKNRTR